MRTDPDHLPEIQQRELERVQRILMDEFAEAISRATQPHKRNGKIYKIILFGSYARDDWVDEPDNGYQSDFDLLIIVSHADLTDIADYWYVAEDKIQRDPSIARPVNIIVHSLDEVNQALRRGEYFWTDIARDGIALYELPCHTARDANAAHAGGCASNGTRTILTSILRALPTSCKVRPMQLNGAKTSWPPFSCIRLPSGSTSASCWCERSISRARTTSSSCAHWPRTRSLGWSMHGRARPSQIAAGSSD